VSLIKIKIRGHPYIFKKNQPMREYPKRFSSSLHKPAPSRI
jgi:hypothetical protein